jgi:hypothetical protein
MRRLAWLALVVPLSPCLEAGCGGDVIAQPIGAGPSDAGDAGNPVDALVDHHVADAPTGTDSSLAPSDAPTDATSFCNGHGPILPGTNGLCAGDLSNLFKFAACACTGFDISGVLTTDSYDSTADAGSTEVASVGANLELSANSTTTIGGSVWSSGIGLASGAPAVSLSGTLPGTVAHDVQAGGPVLIGGPYEVMGDLWANGNVTLQGAGSLKVDGTVHLPAGDTATGVTAVGGTAFTSVSVAAPCDCSLLASAPNDIAGVVSGFKASNDDSAQGLSATSLDDPSSTVVLPCGLYYFDGIHGSSLVSIDVMGRTAVFVDGDVSVNGGITITVAPGAELDLFVAGNVVIQGPSGSVVIGDVTRAAATRIYVGGGGNDAGGGFALSADANIAANIYAPHAVLQLASNFVLRGAILAQALQCSGDFAIHYDTAVLQVPQSSGCQPPAGPCKTCNDCSGSTPACIGGTCAPCKTNGDCCAPLQCYSGSCALPTQ